jgi:DNA-binding SARP family transcriptional activator/WD40 repeat protein
MPRTPASSRLEFRVLGSVEAARDGRPIELGGKRQRALLAALLIDANRAVPKWQLVEELFGSEVSRDAENRLQAGISRLRRALDNGENGDGTASVLVTRPGGYLLRVDTDQIDYAIFERLVEQGREALSRADPSTAATLLRRSFSLWRGPPFADIQLAEVVQAEIRRLNGVRLAAEMDCIDADLALGSDADLVPRLEALVAEHPSQERLVGQLMLALYRSERQADALAVYRTQRRVLRDELGLDPGPVLAELELGILRHDEALDRPPRAAHASPGSRVVVCPYKGLASFEDTDAEYFCGREQMVAALTTRLAGSRLVGIVGASGVGKSSILRAGLLPALAAGALPGSETWEYVVMRPGSHPAAALSKAVRDRNRARPLLLAVDQLEEAFTACDDPSERDRFMTELARLALEPDGGTTVVVALRADFYGRCGDNAPFARLLSGDHVLVGRMSREDTLRAVEVPAAAVGLVLEPGLAATMVDDVGDEPGGLPLLQTALLELWAARRGSELTLESYRSLGGVRGAVARLAERAYSQLDDDGKDAARSVMMRLVAGDGPTAVRRRAPLTELDLDVSRTRRTALDALIGWRLVTVSGEAVEVSHEALLSEWPRLERWMSEDREGRQVHVHLATAAGAWDHEGRDPAELYRGARLAVALEWSAGHASELNQIEADFLARSTQESQREVLAQRRRNRQLRALLAGAGVLLILAVTAGVIAGVQRSHARRAAVAARHSASVAQRSATAALAQSLGAQAISEPQIDRALLLAVEGVRLADSPATRADLLATLLRSPQIVASYYTPGDVRPGSLAVSPDGSRLAVGEYGTAVEIYSTAKRARLAVLHVPDVIAVAYTPDNRTLAVFSVDGLHLFDTGTNRPRRFLPLPTGAGDPTECVRCLVIAGGGRYALTTMDVGGPAQAPVPSVVRWDLRTGAVRTDPFGGSGGTLLATAGGREVVLPGLQDSAIVWNPRTMQPIDRVRLPAGEDLEAVSPSGDTLALATSSGGIAFLNTRTDAASPPVNGGPTALLAATFTPDGRTLLTAGGDGRVAIWDAATGSLVQTDAGHSIATQELAVTPDGHTAYTAALDGSVIAYDLTGRHGLGIPFGNTLLRYGGPWFSARRDASQVALPLQDGRVQLLSGPGLGHSTFFDAFPDRRPLAWAQYSPDGRELVVGAGFSDRQDETGQLPGAALASVAGAAPRRLGELTGFRRGSRSGFDAVAFTPDGRRLIAVGAWGSDYQHGSIGEFDARTGHIIGRVVGVSGVPFSVSLSPDGTRAAVGFAGGRVEIVSAHTLRRVTARQVVHADGNSDIMAIAFSPAGDTIAVGDDAGAVHLVNATTLEPEFSQLQLVAGNVFSLSFTSDGSLLAASGTDATTHVIDVAAWRPVIPPFAEPGEDWTTSQFAGDDRLLTFSQAGTGHLYPLSLTALVSHACRVAHRNLTTDEWNEFLPGRPYRPACASFAS